MSRRELERVAVIGRVASGDLESSQCAEMLELSYGQTKWYGGGITKRAAQGRSMATLVGLWASPESSGSGAAVIE